MEVIKKHKVVVIISIFIIIIIAIIVKNSIQQSKEWKATLKSYVTVAESMDLKDVTVYQSGTYESIKLLTLECSNFDSFSFTQLLRIDGRLDVVATGSFIERYKCNGDTYEIYGATNSIYKNGEEIYNDFQNSEVYKSAADSSGSSSSSSGSTNFSGKDSYGHDKSDAFVIAMREVEGILKAPSTADFCSITEATISCSGNTWTVKG